MAPLCLQAWNARPSRAGLVFCPPMAKPLTAEEILPLVKHLTIPERARLIRLIGASSDDDATAYRLMPPRPDEFSTEAAPLAWDADGWENEG